MRLWSVVVNQETIPRVWGWRAKAGGNGAAALGGGAEIVAIILVILH